MRVGTIPPDVILPFFANETDAFENVGDVINTTLLHVKQFHGIVQVQCLLGCFFQEIDELFSQFNEPILFPTTFSECAIETAVITTVVHAVGVSG